MTTKTQKTDLGQLGGSWLEKVKDIRAMAKENNDKGPLEEMPVAVAEVPSDSELFAVPVQAKITSEQIFSGDEDFFKSLKDSPEAERQSFDAEQILATQNKTARFSNAQKALTAAIILIVAMLLFTILRPQQQSSGQMASISAGVPIAAELPVVQAVQAEAQQAEIPEVVAEDVQPATLEIAQAFYLNENYMKAFGVYEKLHENLPATPKEDLMRDYLQLQLALCMERATDYTQAGRLLRKVLKSDSPAIRTVAYYHYGLLEIQKKQYLNARTKAYQAIALIDALEFDKSWSLSLKQDCYFLAAEAMTRKVLSLCDADNDLPDDLWGNLNAADELFTSLNETELRSFLESGSKQLDKAVLGPQIQQLNQQAGLARYDVICNGAPIEELLARFTANSDVDIQWDLASDEKITRNRLAYLYLPSATTQQFVTASAGCVGLVARMDAKGMVSIFNPTKYSYVSEHTSFLGKEAVSLWQKFLLRFPSDRRLANIHFALGLLHTSQGLLNEAILEYKLVANRFSRSSLSPFALLNSSKHKNSLHNYSGGRKDLKQLIEQFSDTQVAEQAYLYFAETTANAGLDAKATRLYHRVYNLSLSSESQSAAALGAGKCYYNMEEYKSASKWLGRYVEIAKNSKTKELYSAYFLLGKINLILENSDAANDAFQNAFQGGPSRLGKEEYIATISALVDADIQKGQFVAALDMLEDIHSVVLSREETTKILLLKSKALRAMGLVDKAIVILGDKAEYLPNPQLKAEAYFELSECYIDKGDLNFAHKTLTKVLVLAESGPLTHKITFRLAEICLQLGQHDQAISVCSQLLELQPSEKIKQETLGLLAMAYNQQKNYNKAALALLGQWK